MSKEEYLDLSENMRAYSSYRFAHLTLFFAVTAGLLNVLFQVLDPKSSNAIIFTVKVAGLLIAICFAVIEERVADYWHSFKRRAIELETSLKYQQYTGSPSRKWISATNATRILFLATGVFWLIVLLCPSLLDQI